MTCQSLIIDEYATLFDLKFTRQNLLATMKLPNEIDICWKNEVELDIQRSMGTPYSSFTL